MNSKDRRIIEDFRRRREDYVRLGDIVQEKLQAMARDSGILVMGIEHRVKGEKSLEGKLYRSGEWYQKREDLIDLLGARVICYFADDVDRFAALAEQAFVIDWEASSDKRALIQADSFGYLSLHYICALRPEEGYPETLTEIRFELQIRSVMQHAWAQIEHDLGYKSQFGVPRPVQRAFARLAGLLEIADDEFIRARDDIGRYERETREKITSDNAEGVAIDLVSLREYMLRNRKMRAFLQDLAAIEGSEISEVDPESYIVQLKWLGITTIGQLQAMLDTHRGLAFALAKTTLEGTGLDILASNAGLRFLCRAFLAEGGYSEEQAAEFIGLSVHSPERARREAARLLETYRALQAAGEI